MKRIVLLAVVLLLLLAAGALAGLAASQHRGVVLPEPAQARLNQYLAYAFPGSEMEVAAIDRAAHPSQLTAGMAGATFGASVHFQTDTGGGLEAGSLSPLPFPPVDVWCVLIRGQGPPAGRVVLVSLHQDLYTADWILHQGLDDASSVEAHHLLSALGCALTPDRDDFNALDRAKTNGRGTYASHQLAADAN